MYDSITATNTLHYDLPCPKCGSIVRSGIGFRAGKIQRKNYHLGDALDWGGPNSCPPARPPQGNLKTIGYFNCDNPRCDTWRDCFPDIQEALITIRGDVLDSVEAIVFRPEEQGFFIVEG